MNQKPKILIFVVAYNAEGKIIKVLEEIPAGLFEKYATEVLIIDDASQDNTAVISSEFAKKNKNIRVLKNPVNQGYGGNQKIGYHYAIKNNFDVVVLLHGDGQYAPSYLAKMIEPILNDSADAVFGSRMMNKVNALKGRMPLYKFVANIFISKFQNIILKSNLSEFHSGYRAYKVASLAKLPFNFNSNYFDFDTDIIIQLLDNRMKIAEVPIPTYYGDEICYVNGFKYVLKILASTILSRWQRLGLYFHPKFDYEQENTFYPSKAHFASSHKFAIDHVKQGSNVLEFGCGEGFMGKELVGKQCAIYGFDLFPGRNLEIYKEVKKLDLDKDELPKPEVKKIDYILALDVIEHLNSPEKFLRKIRASYSKDRPEVIITTGNIAFWSVRFGLLLGRFTYKKKGILDITHKRLFTFSSIKKLLKNESYEVVEVVGIPAPFPLIIKNKALSQMLLNFNLLLIKISKSLFSFQIGIITRPHPTLDVLLNDSVKNEY